MKVAPVHMSLKRILEYVQMRNGKHGWANPSKRQDILIVLATGGSQKGCLRCSQIPKAIIVRFIDGRLEGQC